MALLLECCAPHGIGPVVSLNAVARYDLPDSANNAFESLLVNQAVAAIRNRWKLMQALAGTPAQRFGRRVWAVRDSRASFCSVALPGGCQLFPIYPSCREMDATASINGPL